MLVQYYSYQSQEYIRDSPTRTTRSRDIDYIFLNFSCYSLVSLPIASFLYISQYSMMADHLIERRRMLVHLVWYGRRLIFAGFNDVNFILLCGNSCICCLQFVTAGNCVGERDGKSQAGDESFNEIEGNTKQIKQRVQAYSYKILIYYHSY